MASPEMFCNSLERHYSSADSVVRLCVSGLSMYWAGTEADLDVTAASSLKCLLVPPGDMVASVFIKLTTIWKHVKTECYGW